jgi:hypothetical protein
MVPTPTPSTKALEFQIRRIQCITAIHGTTHVWALDVVSTLTTEMMMMGRYQEIKGFQTPMRNGDVQHKPIKGGVFTNGFVRDASRIKEYDVIEIYVP